MYLHSLIYMHIHICALLMLQLAAQTPATSNSSAAVDTATASAQESTLLHAIGAAAVLGGHINVLYPGVQAKITADHRAAVQSNSRDALRVSHTGRGFYTHAASRGSSGSSSGSLAAAIASPLVGRSCTVLSISLAENSAEVVLHDADSDSSAAAAATASSSPHQILALDALQALPQVPVNADALQPALCQAVLQSFRAWRLMPPAFTAAAAAEVVAPAASSQTAVSLAAAVQAQCLSTRALLSSVRFLITRAAQGLLLHAPTALAFITAAGDSAGAALLELSATATAAAGLGDIAPLEERWSMLLTQWQQRTLEAREHAVRTAAAKAESAAAAAAAATQAAATPTNTAAASTAAAAATDSATAAAAGGSSSSSGGDTAAAAAGAAVNELAAELTALMSDMGFPPRWCLRALAETGYDMEAALNWILSNGELLSAEDDEAGTEAAEAAAAVEAVAAAEAAAAAAAAASSSTADGSAGDSSSSTAGQAVREGQEQQQQDAASELPPPPSLQQSSQSPAAAAAAEAAGTEAAAAAVLADMWDSVNSSTAAAVAAAAAAGEAVDEGSWPRVFHYDPTSTAPLNLRAEPSTESEQVGTLFACEEITAVAQLGEWLQVQLSDYEGEYMYDEDEDSADEQVSSLYTITVYYTLLLVHGMIMPVKVYFSIVSRACPLSCIAKLSKQHPMQLHSNL
jgi:trimeric autotransporter adhesin